MRSFLPRSAGGWVAFRIGRFHGFLCKWHDLMNFEHHVAGIRLVCVPGTQTQTYRGCWCQLGDVLALGPRRFQLSSLFRAPTDDVGVNYLCILLTSTPTAIHQACLFLHHVVSLHVVPLLSRLHHTRRCLFTDPLNALPKVRCQNHN